VAAVVAVVVNVVAVAVAVVEREVCFDEEV
jgi:hypothetical protein